MVVEEGRSQQQERLHSINPILQQELDNFKTSIAIYDRGRQRTGYYFFHNEFAAATNTELYNQIR